MFRDCECTDPLKLTPEIQKVQKHLEMRFPGRNIRALPVVHALEAWLMAGQEAVKKVLGDEVSQRLTDRPESECRPKDFLKKISKDPFDYRRDDPELAEALNIDTVTRNCPSFREGRKALGDP